MAEGAIVSAVLGVLQGIVGGGLAEGFGLIRGVDRELVKLQSSFSAIQALLVDAEEQRVKNKSLELWLKKVRDVAYQADNVLDEFCIEALRREAGAGNRTFKKVRDFFSCSNQLIFLFRMGRKLKEVEYTLDFIVKEKERFHLEVRVDNPRSDGLGQRETDSFIIEPEIYGRVEEREVMVKLLTADEHGISVIPIVGMGGIGKTTLARLAYNDATVKQTFHLRMWVCVSEDFNVMRLIRSMVESAMETTALENETMDKLQHRLQEIINGKKFLLVLDDVWNVDRPNWERLRGYLQTCAKGSKVVVTTRSKKIASMVETVDHYDLKALSDDDCWALFEREAFRGRSKEEYPELVSIGKEIVKKYNGLPLAAKALGSLMVSQINVNDWMAIRHSEIWQLREGEILPALMLSYYHLPSYLKPCFIYCALFPKDSKIKETTFIWLWMAEGLIPSHNLRSPQDIGKEYLRELVSRSLFQLHGFGYYVVHDLVHDLAKYIADDACSIVQAGGSIHVPQFCHCLTLSCDQNTIASPKEFCRTETLRTLLFFRNRQIKEVPPEIFVSLSKLRALDFSGCPIRELPDSIGSLKHLKYINLSNAQIKVVPQSICSLRKLQILVLHDTMITSLPPSLGDLLNLQVLDLSYCSELQSLPLSIGDLQNLNVLRLIGCENLQRLPESAIRLQKLNSLELDYCFNLQELPTGLSNMTNLREIKLSDCKKLTHMPIEMGKKLNGLQELSTFIVSEERGSSIAELRQLTNLGGQLEIWNLGKLKDPGVAREANLKEKQNIRSLSLLKGEDELADDVAVEVLEGLEPPQNITKLKINGGTEFPGWLKSNTMESFFPNLVSVILRNFKGCKLLPPLGQLKSLETLEIGSMDSIEVVGREFCGSNGGVAFPFLKNIIFWNMPKWKTWLSLEEDENIGQEVVAFPHFTHLRIYKCPELTSLPFLPYLTKLYIYECPELTSLPFLPYLIELYIYECPEITSLPCLPSLQVLTISHSVKLLKSARSLRELGVGSLERLNIKGEGGEDVGVLEGLRDLSSVEILAISGWMMDSMQHLFSTIQKLTIWCTEEMHVLPETIGDLVSLQSLRIWNGRITSLGQGLRRLTALRDLCIWNCEELGCMPEYMGSLTSLQSLEIWECPHLERRCEREKGEDWHLISHIPNINIYKPYLSVEEDNPRLKKKAITVVKERLSACFTSTSST